MLFGPQIFKPVEPSGSVTWSESSGRAYDMIWAVLFQHVVAIVLFKLDFDAILPVGEERALVY